MVACAKTSIKPECVNHVFDDGIVLREKGCNNNGLRRYTCSICGYQKDEIIPMGHRYYYEEIDDETHIKKCLDCEVEVIEKHTKELRSIGSEDPILRCKYCNEGNLPRIDIKTKSNIVKNKYVSCTITTSNYLDEYLFEDAECEIKVRGNATANYRKHTACPLFRPTCLPGIPSPLRSG